LQASTLQGNCNLGTTDPQSPCDRPPGRTDPLIIALVIAKINAKFTPYFCGCLIFFISLGLEEKFKSLIPIMDL